MAKCWVEDRSLAKASTVDDLGHESRRSQRRSRAFGTRIRLVEKQDGEVHSHVAKIGTFVQASLQNYLQLSTLSSSNLGLSSATI